MKDRMKPPLQGRVELKEILVGKSALEVFSCFVSSLPNVRKVEFISFIRSLDWQRHPDYPHLGEQLDRGFARIRTFDRKAILKENFWERRLEDLKKIEVPKNSPITTEQLAIEWKSWIDGEDEDDDDVYIGFTSKVLVSSDFLKREWQQIPLIDFQCTPSQDNLNAVKDMLARHEDTPGIILNSGASFHFWGLRTMPEKDWKLWIEDLIKIRYKEWWIGAGSSLDLRHLENSRDNGKNFLRLTKGLEKRQIPIVVAIV